MIHSPKSENEFDNNLLSFRRALQTESPNFGIRLSEDAVLQLGHYFEMIEKWNPRLHLVAPCSPEEFASRHVLESLTLLPYLAEGARVTDIGSGGGLPMIPCLIVRPDLRAIMIEASGKKAVFLREALKATATRADVLADRFERLNTPETDVVTCRAIERFEGLLPELFQWAPTGSTLLLFAGEGLQNRLDQMKLHYSSSLMPGSDHRFLFVVSKDD